MRLREALAVPLFAAAAMVMVCTVWADDFAPPPWRGGPNYTLQGWEFLDGGNQVSDGYVKVADDPAVAQRWGNGPVPFGAPVDGFGNSTSVPLATWTPDFVWDAGADGDGGWTAGQTISFMTLWIPNWIDNELTKLLRIQLTYDGIPPTVIAPIAGGFGNDFNNIVPGVPLGPPVVVDSRHYYQDWIIQPNPHWERLGITFVPGTRIDEIVVDTISFTIPEPSSVALLILAIAGPLAWRRNGHE